MGEKLKKLLLLLLILSAVVNAQEPVEKVVRITQFGGLNTRQSDFTAAPNEFRLLDEWDLNRNPGSLTPRFGYDNQGVISGADSIIGIFGAYFSDGRQRLFYVADSSGVGYGNIYATPMNSVSGTQTRVATEWPIINKPQFAIYQDRVWVVNGNGRSGVYDNESFRDFPPYAPGEPKIVPLKTSGNLNGEYVYVLRWRENVGSVFSGRYGGDPTQRIKVQNGQVLLKNFHWVSGTSGDTTPDSIQIRIYRTKANPGILDEGDTAYWVGTDIGATNASDLATKSFTDNIADGSLNADSFVVVVDTRRVGDNTGGGGHRYGAPWQVHAVAGAAGRNDSGVNAGAPTSLWGYAYACTFIDTTNGMESILSPAWYQYTADGDDSIGVGIPNPPSSMTGYRVNLYRSLVVYARWDTTWQVIPEDVGFLSRVRQALIMSGRKCIKLPNGSYKCFLSDQPVYDPGGKRDSVYNLGQYFFVAQLNPSDTMFIDTLAHDSVTSNFENLYGASVPMSPMETIVSLEDRLFGSYGSTVSFSDLDTASRWFVFNRASVSAQDGQRITSMWGQRDALRVGKTESLHNFYQTADTIWNLSEVTHHIGVVAPHSVAQGLGGTYYYTSYGVMRETEGLYRDRQFGVEPISQKIAALDTIPVSKKQDAIGTYYNQAYILSLPQLGDSGQSYVYFEKADAWARWPNLCFGGATLYSTETDLSFLPGDTLYFFKPGGATIYRMTNDTADNVGGTEFQIRLAAQTVPLMTEDLRFEKRITEVGVGLKSTGSTDTLVVAYKDEEGVTRYTDSLTDTTERYTLLGGKGNALFWQIYFSNASVGGWGNTVIDRLDIYYNETLKDRVK